LIYYIDRDLKEISLAMTLKSTQTETNDEPHANKYNLRPKKPIEKKLIRNPMLSYYTYEEMDYYISLSKHDRSKISQIELDIQQRNKMNIPLRFHVLNTEINNNMKSIVVDKLNHLYTMDNSSSEYHKTENWIQDVCRRIPLGKYKSLPVDTSSSKEDIRNFLTTMKNRMDVAVYGHTDAKEHIVRLLAQWISNPTSKGLAIGIHGPMGCGKTTLVKDGLCAVLGLPFGFVSLGGASDGSYLYGHGYTYEHSKHGKIVDILMQAQCMNPVIFFDELDKVSETLHGQEIINTLIHLTDSTQNDKFNDKYFSEFDFDLSRCLMIFTYNDESKVNPILLDRIVRIETKGYTNQDKIVICKSHMIPTLLKEYNIAVSEIMFSDNVITTIIDMVDEEHGVRNLRRALVDILGNLNLHRMLDTLSLPYTVTESDVKKYVFHPKKKNDMSKSMMYL
jgi:ATP-dependent Lon protease